MPLQSLEIGIFCTLLKAQVNMTLWKTVGPYELRIINMFIPFNSECYLSPWHIPKKKKKTVIFAIHSIIILIYYS